MSKFWAVVLLAISFVLDLGCHPAWSQSASSTTTGIIPVERNFAWNPGLMSKGGIPKRSTVCATLSPGENIQVALSRCPPGQVVQLNAGTYIVNDFLIVNRGITLRGAGAGQTILVKTNGAPPRTSTVVAGTKGILAPAANAYIVPDAQPIIIVGLSRWPNPAASTIRNLTSDRHRCDFSDGRQYRGPRARAIRIAR